MTRWTSDQVEGLAPDSASVAAARKLASGGAFEQAGHDDHAVWALIKGSGKSPYAVAVDLAGPAYKCSCPSRKIPCKHALATLLRWAADGTAEAGRPEFVSEWLSSRTQRAEAAATRREKRGEPDEQGRAERTAKRAAAIEAGLAELETWLEDLLRQGLASARERPRSSWDTQARRLVDAQAPGLADRVRRIEHVLLAGQEGWPARALEQAAMLHLAATSWRDERLPADLRDDLRAHLGWPLTLADVERSTAPIDGPWNVLGVRTEREGRLHTRRTWLEHAHDGRLALLLDFAASGAAFAGAPLAARDVVTSAMHPFPGRSGLRVTPAGTPSVGGRWDGPGPEATISAALDRWATAIARDPFCDRIAVSLAEVVPQRHEQRWWLREPDGTALPLAGDEPWELVAAAAGRPVALTAEWDGAALSTVSVMS